ncbi:MAG: hypothetical protein WC289_05875 [Patescibacteria group bacterium]|jgi:hypothetical protein
MGSHIELNDTLQITNEQGFPAELTLERHVKQPFTADDFRGRVFSFTKPDLRIYHPAPNRVFLAQNIGGKWIYWGHVQIIKQSINAEQQTTLGEFIITKIYSPEYQRDMTANETDEGKNFFEPV